MISAAEPTPPTPVRPAATASVPPTTDAVPAATVEVPQSDPAVVTESSGGLALPIVAVGLLVALAAGVAIGYLLRTSGPDRPSAPVRGSTTPRTPATVPAAPPTQGGPTPGVDPAAMQQLSGQLAAEQQRSTGLVEALIELRDRVDNPALSERVGSALQAAGWYTVDPTGEPFDPDRHRSVDRDTTDDPGLHRTVAITERLGYQDARGNVLRIPEVVVYHHDADADPFR